MRYFLEDIGEPDWGESSQAKILSRFLQASSMFCTKVQEMFTLRLDTCQKKYGQRHKIIWFELARFFSARAEAIKC